MPEPQTPQPDRYVPCTCGGETNLDAFQHRSATCNDGCMAAEKCPNDCHCAQLRKDADNLDQIVAFLTARNLRLVDVPRPGRESARLNRLFSVVEAWGEDDEKSHNGLIEELVETGLAVCTAKAAQRKPGKFATLFQVFADKQSAVFYSHVKPEILALCERGTPITLAEYKELRGNSHDWALIHRNLDDEALLYQARRTAENCTPSLAKVSRWDVPTTYDDAMAMIFVPQLLQRFEALLKKVQGHQLCRCGHEQKRHPDRGIHGTPCMENCGCIDFELAPEHPAHDPGCVATENHDGPCPTMTAISGTYSSGDTNP